MAAWVFLCLFSGVLGPGVAAEDATCKGRCERERQDCVTSCKDQHSDDGNYGECVDACGRTRDSCESSCNDCHAGCMGALQKCTDACPSGDGQAACCDRCSDEHASCFSGKCGVAAARIFCSEGTTP